MIKTYLTTVFIWFLTYTTLLAGTWVVSNNPENKAEFASIQSAVEQALPGDTILVKGSPINYGNVILEKPIILIADIYGEDNPKGHTAKLTRILLTANPYRRTISSGSAVIGFEFPYFPGKRPNIVTVSDDRALIKDVLIEKNWMWFVEILGSAENWTFRHNIIRGWVNGSARKGTDMTGATNFVFHNNVINTLKGFDRGNIEIHNNIVMGRLQDIMHASVVNNIFVREGFILENVVQSTFQNNITYGVQIGNEECYEHPDRFESVNRCIEMTNQGSGNKVGIDPGFVYWPLKNVESVQAFQLKENSVARNAGKGGTQAGIFGGDAPFPIHGFLKPEIDDPFPSFITSIY